MKYVFGIDGGGTSSRLRIESLEGGKLFYAEGGSSNPNARVLSEIEATFIDLFARARQEAGLASSDCLAGFVGSAGIDRGEDRSSFAAMVRRAAEVDCPVAAGNDAEPALAGALGDTEGILLIAGTGAIAFGRARDGFAARAGGWGHLLGDEGSAWRIAFDAICRSLRSSEGRDLATDILPAALDYFGLPNPAAFIPYIYGGIDKTSIAGFARVVGEFRDKGDALAIDLFEVASRELEGLVRSVYRIVEPRLERRRLALRGGLIESDASLQANLREALARSLPDLAIVKAKADASTGACILARSLLRQ